MSGKKILFAISALGSGGAERVATTLSNAWAKRGDSVTLVATFSGRGDCFYPLSASVKTEYLADRINCKRKSIINQFKRLLSLRRLMTEFKPDVVISFLTNVNVASIIAVRGLRVPIIVCERNDVLQQKIPTFLSIKRRIVYPYADIVVAQTNNAIDNLNTVCPRIKNVCVIPNPLSPEIDAVSPSLYQNNRTRGRIIAMGRLVEQKNYVTLIELFAKVVNKFTDWDLWIFGEGPLRSELENQIKRNNLTDRVFLPGATKKPWEEMKKSDIFVLTSHYEGFPNVLMEAMAVGLPCVAFDCPCGPREISRDGEDAFLIPLGQEAEFESALRRLMSDERLRQEMGDKAAKSVRERYSLDKVLDIWDQIFQKIGVE